MAPYPKATRTQFVESDVRYHFMKMASWCAGTLRDRIEAALLRQPRCQSFEIDPFLELMGTRGRIETCHHGLLKSHRCAAPALHQELQSLLPSRKGPQCHSFVEILGETRSGEPINP